MIGNRRVAAPVGRTGVAGDPLTLVEDLDRLVGDARIDEFTLSNGIRKADLDTLDAYVSSIGSWRKLARIAQSIPLVRNLVGSEIGGVVSFLTIRDQIICICPS